MGSRLLRLNILQPPTDLVTIMARQKVVKGILVGVSWPLTVSLQREILVSAHHYMCQRIDAN